MTDKDVILQSLAAAERERLESLEVFDEIGSTNTYLLEQPVAESGRFRVAIANHQTEGRGRQGKTWVSPPSSCLCMSVSFTFAETPRNLPSLTLATGVGIAGLLQVTGVDDVALKWPNDIVARGGKLGGILTEAHSRGSRGQTVVIGIGLNVDLPDEMHDAPAPGWASKVTDLKECIESLPSRPVLTAGILQCVLSSVARFQSDGFAAFHAAWGGYDWLKGKSVYVDEADARTAGIADGVGEDGALLVRTADGMRRITSGSVSVAQRLEARA